MKERILQLVLDSFRDQFYPKALDCVKTLREEALKVKHHHGIFRRVTLSLYDHNCVYTIIFVIAWFFSAQTLTCQITLTSFNEL